MIIKLLYMEIKQTAGRDALNDFAPKFAALNDDVLFGEVWSGDAVTVPAGVKHRHGASKDSWFTHIAIECTGVHTRTEWAEPVTDEEYNKL